MIGSDADGLVAKVELFDGNQLVASNQPNQGRTSRITLSTVIAIAGLCVRDLPFKNRERLQCLCTGGNCSFQDLETIGH